MEIIKVVLTGGPCAGKTTALNSIKEYLTHSNIPFVTVPETAAELIGNGMPPTNKAFTYFFQTMVLQRQLFKEKMADRYVNKYHADKKICVIIYDRGVLDNKAYLNSGGEFNKLLMEYGLSEIEILDSYDLILDLLSLASCKKEFYNLSNGVRNEDVDAAAKLDEKTSFAWIHHRNLKIINSSVSLEEETKIIIDYISELINGFTKKEIRRFLVNDCLSDYSLYNINNSETLFVTDYCLDKDKEGFNYVISKREYNYGVSYIYNVYIEENGIIYTKIDKKISEEEFYNLMMKHDVINKIERMEVNFINNKQKYKLCYYDDYTILELEENKLNDKLILPSNLAIIEEILNSPVEINNKNKIKVKVIGNGNI